MTVAKKQTVYDDEFKRNAVELTIHKPTRRVEKDLGIPDRTLRDWRKKYLSEKPFQESLEQEVQRLRQSHSELLQENEILKKSVAIFLKPRR